MRYIISVLTIVFSIGMALATVQATFQDQVNTIISHEKRIASIEHNINGQKSDIKSISTKLDLLHNDIQLIKSYIMYKTK